MATIRRTMTVLALVLAFSGTATSAQAQEIDAGACQIKHVRLVDANAYVVVAEIPQDSIGFKQFGPSDRLMCDTAIGVWRPLTRTAIDPYYDILRISGHYVGFGGGQPACENCVGDDSFVGVKNAQTGHTVFLRNMHPTESDDARGFTVHDMTLKPNGSVAFTTVGNWRHNWGRTRSVVKHDLCDGTRVLDSSPRDVRVNTLKRRGSQLRWRHGDRPRTARLC